MTGPKCHQHGQEKMVMAAIEHRSHRTPRQLFARALFFGQNQRCQGVRCGDESGDQELAALA
jgi:hypothetical protein